MLGGKMESGKKKIVGDSGNGRFLQEIEALSKALYINKNPPKKMDLISSTSSGMRSISAGKSHLHETPKTTKPRVFKGNPNPNAKDPSSQKEKKSSIWNWPLRALSHIRNRRFNCSFSLHVHSIEQLSPEFNGASLRIHWKRRDGSLETRPARVFQGIAEFEETLTHKCSVYGTGNGPHHSAKYEAKYFLLYASIVGALDLDLGKHRIDLTRLLPLTLEELEEEKSSGKWTTSFKLSGKAKGAILNVSFGFLVLGDDSVGSGGNRKGHENLNLEKNRIGSMKSTMGDGRGSLRHVGSVLGAVHAPRERSHFPSQSVDDVKILHEVFPSLKLEVSSSLTYQKFDEGEFGDALVDSKPEFQVFSEEDPTLVVKPYPLSESGKENSENGCDDSEFNVIEQGIEVDAKDDLKLEENMRVVIESTVESSTKLDEIDCGNKVTLEEVIRTDLQDESCGSCKEDNLFTKELVMEELDSAFRSLSILEAEGWDSPESQSRDPGQANYAEAKSSYKTNKMGKSLSLDDVTESVASEFLSMLGVEHSPFGLSSDSDPESPRESLWKQFKRESLGGNNTVFGLDVGNGMETELANDGSPQFDLSDLSEDFGLSSIVHAAETEHERASQAMRSKTRAKMLEDAETEALMREWGLNEKAFQSSPRGSGFGSPIHLPPEEPFDLPPLCEGLGSYVQTKDGGFLRSMDPSLFRNAKNNGSLIMQVSSPVVVPAEMGSGVMEILQRLASVGIEKLSMQASKLMPLEDITGKTMQQLAWEATPTLEARESQDLLHHLKPEGVSEFGQDVFGGQGQHKASTKHRSKLNFSSSGGDTGSEYVSLEDLAPLAMDKIEALSIEGLRIQSGMSDEEAPSNICPQSIGEISALEGMRAKSSMSLGLEGTAGLQLLDIKDSGDDVDGLMGLSISLDEWMRLDAGIVDEEEQISSRTSKILAAHHANCTDLINGGFKGDKRGGKNSGRRCGLLGNNFTVALMVQLRDPLRNYEPVGSPMLSLIQVERVFIPPKPKIYYSVSDKGNSEEADEPEPMAKEDKKKEEEVVPQFKITEVHVAGLKTEPGKKKLWGSSTQQQSGSRWLVASGMRKSNKHPFMKSKPTSKSPQVSTTTVQPGDTLWSISARVHGTGAKWKELAALNPHIRNPNVIFPNEKIRLQ
ncbi:protein PLASTID MOVEMENT IMPAIRED 1-RELATED 1-like [Tasmannia lanceolata]|uniref:protein PLASTID MOVEMENT IMPAIRED 1-RELATED 1-like n=1 Tax=Tasmannia lanceolata TaxID=3420 RepID=UPI004063E70F